MGEVLKEKFLEEGSDGAGADADEDVVDGDLGVVAVAVRVVAAGDAASGEVAEDIGVIRLPVSVVALADDDGRYGVERAVDDLPFAFVEVARILMEERWEESSAKEGGSNAVAIGSAIAPGVTAKALAVTGEVPLPLLNTCRDAGGEIGDGIDGDLDGELELLCASEWCGIGDVTDVKVWQHADDALLDFSAYLLLGLSLPG